MLRLILHSRAWWLLLYCGLSTVCASNPTNSQVSWGEYTSTEVAEASSEQELERSLQEFDEKILRELEQTQQQRQENARQKSALRSDAELESEQGVDEGEGEGEGEAQQNAGADGEQGNEAGNETAHSTGQQSSAFEVDEETAQQSGVNAGQTDSTSRAGEASSTTQTATLPSGDDDDVIARQLREAAEAETDPEIKEKLWQEYRKYKNQQGTSASQTVP